LLSDFADVKFAQAAVNKSGSIGSNRHVAILFADIEGCTPLSERMPSFDVMYLLNRYFDVAGDVVLRNGGEINNYIGDASLAIFGLDNAGDDAFRAVSAGLELQEKLIDFARIFERDFSHPLRVRIGVHYGEVIVGMLGSRGTERLSIIGDTVNIAERTESANKDAGTSMLITESAYQQIQDRVSVKDFVRVKLRGTAERVTLYEI
jgi:class 3 adenylate cyclase